MKMKVLAPCIVTIALLLTLSILAMITNLTLEHLRNRKTVSVSYPCIVVKGDKWIRSVDLEMRTYVVPQYHFDTLCSENVLARR
jgi:predicted CDP-diglyceride synthetase/phosphatidate cytidylyltransferase